MEKRNCLKNFTLKFSDQKESFFISLQGQPLLKRKKGSAFIVIEGLDGSGQSTQAGFLKDFLSKKGYQIVLTKEPTLDSLAGKKIKETLEEKIKISSLNLQKLFIQDRKEHLKNLIIPALKKNKTVISDRYFFSTFAFGSAAGLNLKKLIQMNRFFLLPDLIFILKVSPKVCLKRIEKRGEKIKLFEKKEKLTRAWQAYEKLPGYFKKLDFFQDIIYIIDGEKTPEKVFSQVKKIVLCQLKNNKKRR